MQKILAAAGVASRRQAELLIAEGRVVVNGTVARTGMTVDSEVDSIAVDGRRLVLQAARIYLALNKPSGYVTSLAAERDEPTVAELLADVRARVFPAGRLDRDTTGLLLFSNDGAWSNLVTHPRYQVQKEYRLLVKGRVPEDELQSMRAGIRLPDGSLTAPATVASLRSAAGSTMLSVTVMEGRKRQIRLMAAAIGHPVIALRRIRVGPVLLGNLPEGRWRTLTRDEVEEIFQHAHREAGGRGAPTAAQNRN